MQIVLILLSSAGTNKATKKTGSHDFTVNNDFDDVFDTMSIAADANEFLDESFPERPERSLKRKNPW